MPIHTRNLFSLIFSLLLVLPWCAHAGSFSISTEPQTIEPGEVSGAITVTSAAPASVSTCVLLASDSPSGQFSSSATTWNSVSAVTMSKNTSNRSFFYKDTAQGPGTLTVRIAPKPDTVSASCANWTDAGAAVQETLTQGITIGADAGQQPQSHDTTDTQTANTTPSSQQSQTAVVGSVGSETLVVTIKTQPVVVVGGGSFFAGSASDSGGPTGNGTRYLWNFGDGATDEGKTVFHTYTYPGKYVATLTAGSGNEAGMVRTTVEATPAHIGMLIQPDGSVVLSNQSSQELNIGLWSITSATSSFSIPQDTILLPNMSVRFSTQVMRLSAVDDASLRYPNGSLAADAVPHASAPPALQAAARAAVPAVSKPVASPKQSVTRSANTNTPPTTPQLAAAGQVNTPISAWVYVLGFVGAVLLLLGAVSYAAPGLSLPSWTRKGTKSEADEFEVLDE